MSVLSLQDMIAECYLSLQRSATNKKSLLLALLGLVAAQGESLTCFSELLFKQGAGSTFDTLSICPAVSKILRYIITALLLPSLQTCWAH